MASIFCCSKIRSYKPKPLDHESKFNTFMIWSDFILDDSAVNESPSLDGSEYVVQLIRQQNFGPLESKRYFASGSSFGEFMEISEKDIVEANFEKLNSYKNYKCTVHNKFFELNLYQKDPINKHHWRANVVRPSADIDLSKNPADQSGSSVTKVGTPSGDAHVKLEDTGSSSHEPAQQVAPQIEMRLSDALRAMMANSSKSSRRGYESDDYKFIGDKSSYSGQYEEDASAGDFAACSSDGCGYCGNCSY